MFRHIAVAVALVAGFVPGLQGQETSRADSLVGHWLQRGVLASWHPTELLSGCPDLAAWQRRGIALLVDAELSRERSADLARAWARPLRECGNPAVEQWYFDQVNAAMARGDAADVLLPFWRALSEADSPRIRGYLRALMLDTGKPERYRGHAGYAFFRRFGQQERMREYLSAFQTRRMPFDVAVAESSRLLRQDAEGLLRSVGELVRANPELADQAAFTQIAESSDRYASAAARRALGQALNEGLRRSALRGRQRTRLEATAAWLEGAPRR